MDLLHCRTRLLAGCGRIRTRLVHSEDRGAEHIVFSVENRDMLDSRAALHPSHEARAQVHIVLTVEELVELPDPIRGLLERRAVQPLPPPAHGTK